MLQLCPTASVIPKTHSARTQSVTEKQEILKYGELEKNLENEDWNAVLLAKGVDPAAEAFDRLLRRHAQFTVVPLGCQSGKRRWKLKPSGITQLESVYSCDSLIERIGDDDDDDSDPYGHRAREYLDEHFEEMGLPGQDSMQYYADLKVAEVLARGTLMEEKKRKTFKKMRQRMKKKKVITAEYSEAHKIMNDIQSTLKKPEDLETCVDAFKSIKSMIQNEFDEESVYEIPKENVGLPATNGLVEVRHLAKELLSSSSEQENEDSSGDESIDFTSFAKIRLSNRNPQEFTNDDKKEVGRLLSSSIRNERSHNTRREEHHDSMKNKQKAVGEQEKCEAFFDAAEMKISRMKMIILFKEQIYNALRSHVRLMQASEKLMKHRLFHIWVNRQVEGLTEMKKDIVKRKGRIEKKIAEMSQRNREEDESKLPKMRDTKKVYDKNPVVTNKRWEGTIKCIREREKILMKKYRQHFLSGVINGKNKIEIWGNLKKTLPLIPSEPRIPPAHLEGNRRVMQIISKIIESTKPLITYGDLLRLLNQDDSLTLENYSTISTGEEETPSNNGGLDQNVISCRGINNREGNPDINCPLFTKKEFDNYIRMLNDNFFPTPNFKFIEALLAFDEDAFICEVHDILDLHHSLEKLEKDIYSASKLSGPHSRAIYFFQYKPEFSALDVQDAYEKYIHENNAMDDELSSHPFGCLLLYPNVALGIVMIEGKVRHLFNHFAGFQFSPVHNLILSGRVLYVRENVLECFLQQWVSLTIVLPPGKITYLTKTKKVLHRVAEPRAYNFKEKLHKFYRLLSESKYDEENEESSDKKSCVISDPKINFESCPCHKVGIDRVKEEPQIPLTELLPSPALVMYLLKYKKLKSIDNFIDEYFMQPELDSEDEKYNMVENGVLSNYVDSDEEKDKPKIIKVIKRICKERDIISKLRREVMENVAEERSSGRPPPWIEKYNIDSFNPELVNIEVRKAQESGPSIRIDQLIDKDEEPKKDEEVKNIEFFYESGKLPAQRKFVSFLETGSECWQKKLKRFDLTGHKIKEMIRDAHKYKQLKAIMRLQKKIAAEHDETTDEENIGENVVREEQEEKLEEERLSVVASATDVDEMLEEVEELLEELEDDEYELDVMDGEFVQPHLHGEAMGEFFIRKRFEDYPRFEWDGESVTGKRSESFVGHESGSSEMAKGGNIEESSRITEQTSKILDLEEEESMPVAPPATSVTDSSTDP